MHAVHSLAVCVCVYVCFIFYVRAQQMRCDIHSNSSSFIIAMVQVYCVFIDLDGGVKFVNIFDIRDNADDSSAHSTNT